MGQFSHNVVGTMLGDHLYLASMISDRQWDTIKALCDHNREKPTIKVHSMQENHRSLYEASSD
jgi:hypothetical protein